MDRVKIKRALISVSDKSNLDALVAALQTFGVEILASGGTYQYIKGLGLSPIEISDYTGHPELFDGRVKTLHPKIHGGILAIRGHAEHQKQMDAHRIPPIDLVVVSLYPFESAMMNPSLKEEEVIEKIDIGGPSLIRSAAKNYRYVSVLVDPAQYAPFLEELARQEGETSLSFRKNLAKDAFTRTAAFDAAISAYFAKGDPLLPETFNLSMKNILALRYGENPHQQAGFYIESYKGKTILENILQGKQLSYNNIQDVHAGVSLSLDLNAKYSTVIIKHNNPCGVGLSEKSLQDAYDNALSCDPVSAFGGIVVFNSTVGKALAEKVGKIFTEIVVSPGFEPEALEQFKKKTNLRLIELEFDAFRSRMNQKDIRRALDGYLVQEADKSMEDLVHAKVVTSRSPTKEEYHALELAWRTCKHVKSNAIVIATPAQTVGIGAGQMNRLASVKIASQMSSKHASPFKALASDAFFPFRDNVDELQGSGISCIVQPGGSIKDDEVIKAANEYRMAMIFTGVRHFSH